jgi:hypothetical protein
LSEPVEKEKKATLTERVTKLEARLDEVSKKMDAIVGYQRQLYEYLEKQKR